MSSLPAPVVPALQEKLDFYSFTRSRLAALLRETLDLPPFRSLQLFKWVYGKDEQNFSAMTDIKQELRGQLESLFAFPAIDISDLRESSDGTVKFLFRLSDGAEVETVLIRQPDRNTLCLSSQVGCGMHCAFCRTAGMGLRRNLSTSEILRQFLNVRAHLRAKGGDEINNVVFMGMGEPLHNFDGVFDACDVLADESGLALSPRRITVSTSGLVSRIDRANQLGLRASLAVSLNATTDEVRSRLMPVNRRYPLRELLAALRRFKLKRGRRITIEYVLIPGVNDFDEDLRRLPKLLRGLPVKVNLVPYNPYPGSPFAAPAPQAVSAWAAALNAAGLCTTIRWSRGADILAACGQLAAESSLKTITGKVGAERRREEKAEALTLSRDENENRESSRH